MDEYQEQKMIDEIEEFSSKIATCLLPMFIGKNEMIVYPAMARSLVLLGKIMSLSDDDQKRVLDGWLDTYSELSINNFRNKS